jgi:hypothetical protein
MSIAPQHKMKANFAQTIEADDDTFLSLFLTDHGFDRQPDEYNIWINRRRVGGDAEIERGDHVTIGPRSIRKVRALSATRPRVERRKEDRKELFAMLREWADEASEETSESFEEFKKAINETRAREGRPPVYP